MEMAIEEMLKSRSEHTSKHDPLVGAVLVAEGGHLLGTAHRGALRIGDHAEFTLIERLCRDKNLEGSTLYVTLEPCTKREQPKTPCANRVVSARINHVFIGMLDPNPEIQGRGTTLLQHHSVEVDFFDLDLCQQIRSENLDFIEQYDRAEEALPAEGRQEGPSEKEKEAVAAASVEDFSSEVVASYMETREENLRIPSQKLWTLFHKNGFVADGGDQKHQVPTVAGLLLFGKQPQDFLVQCKLKVEVRKGGKMKAEDIGGPMLTLPDRTRIFLEEYGPTHTVIRGFRRNEEPDFPWEAIREALMNAIVHRDYREGGRVIIQVSPDRFIVKSPGLPLKPLSLAKIRAYNAPPFSRNPRIADTFSRLKLMEERGWGLSRMRDQLVSRGFPPPQFSIEGGYFVVAFFGQEGTPGKIHVPSELLAKLDKRQSAIIELLHKHGRITRAECMKHFKVSDATATRDLGRLVDFGLLEARGKGPSTYYVFIGS